RDPALLGMEQLLEVVHALGVEIEELERHAYRIAGIELAQVAHVHLSREAGMPPRLDVVDAAADELEGLVDRAVEQHVVVGHVEVTVVVDPVGLDPHHRGHERRKEEWFEVYAIQHGTHTWRMTIFGPR